MRTTLLIDGNNQMFAAQTRKGVKLHAGGHETTAVFGMLGSLRQLAERFPGARQLLLWDHSPTWRHKEFPDYKGKRDDNPVIVEAKAAIRKQRPLLSAVTKHLNVTDVTAKGYEADDLGGLLSKRLSKTENIVCITNDGDWLQNIGHSVDWFDPREKKLVSAVSFYSHTGYETQDQFVQAKAIQGDVSDNLSGVGGLGEGAANLILSEFGSVEALRANWDAFEPTIGKGHAFSRYKKKIRAFLESEEGARLFDRNMRFMDLRSVSIPANCIELQQGKHDEKAFIHACAKLGFMSIVSDYKNWYHPFTLPKR